VPHRYGASVWLNTVLLAIKALHFTSNRDSPVGSDDNSSKIKSTLSKIVLTSICQRGPDSRFMTGPRAARSMVSTRPPETTRILLSSPQKLLSKHREQRSYQGASMSSPKTIVYRVLGPLLSCTIHDLTSAISLHLEEDEKSTSHPKVLWWGEVGCS
jgi:hypothetical protein